MTYSATGQAEMANLHDMRDDKQALLGQAEWLADYYRHAWKMGHHEIDALRGVVAELRAENARLRGAVSGRGWVLPGHRKKLANYPRG